MGMPWWRCSKRKDMEADLNELLSLYARSRAQCDEFTEIAKEAVTEIERLRKHRDKMWRLLTSLSDPAYNRVRVNETSEEAIEYIVDSVKAERTKLRAMVAKSRVGK